MPSLTTLRREAAGCRACDLWRDATQTVFGEGRSDATIVLVGEAPGDQEDLAGKPFVGPAGRVLDEALDEAGIDRDSVYVTNAVKHFKWKARGKRRIHDKPASSEVDACRPWLDLELEAIEPAVVVALGATAAQSLLGRSFRVTKRRGELIEGTGIAPFLVATVHPSAVLRIPDAPSREEARRELARDLAIAAGLRCARRRFSVADAEGTQGRVGDALLVIDVVNTFEHDEADALLASFRSRADGIEATLAAARSAGMPVVYVNDTRGRWDGDAPAHVRAAVQGKGGDIVSRLAPAPGDRFIFKPRYSVFDHTPLALVLAELEADRVFLAGAATEGCVVQSGIDARELGLKATILAGACATVDEELEGVALAYAERVGGIRVHTGRGLPEGSE